MSSLQKITSSLSISQIGSNLVNTEIEHYNARINRENPASFVFLIDQSGSMREKWGADNSKSKAEIVALYVNNAINEVINICQKSEPEPRHYFEIAIIGYGSDEEAQLLWEGNLQGKTFVTPAELKQNPTGNQGEIELTREIRGIKKTVKIPVPFWFSPVAKSLTPMGDAFDKCTELLNEWTQKHFNSFPPIVINITDGEQTDCDDDVLLKKAYNLRQTHTRHGKSLLFNVHISTLEESAVTFPESLDELPENSQAKLLYEMSSVLPTVFKKRVATEVKKSDLLENTNYVAMSFQAAVNDFMKFLNIGTVTLQPK